MRNREPHKRWDATGKRIPVRTCVACRSRRAQVELVRIARDGHGWLVDPQRKQVGRGWYVCRDNPACRSVKALGRLARAEAPSLAEALERFFTGNDHEINTDATQKVGILAKPSSDCSGGQHV